MEWDEDRLLATIPHIARSVIDGHYQRIALQFPDSLLGFAVAAATRLDDEIRSNGAKVFVLGDTQFGECCVDEVAAQHVNADLVVHFGHTCLSTTRSLPVLYEVSPREEEDRECVERMVAAVNSVQVERGELGDGHTNGMVGLLYDVELYPVVCAAANQLRDRFVVAQPRYSVNHGIVVPAGEARHGGTHIGPLVLTCSSEISGWLYIGKSDSTPLRNFLLREHARLHSTTPVRIVGWDVERCTFVPIAWEDASNQARRLLSQRFAVLQRVKTAARIAIVAGTLAVQGQMESWNRCKEVIQHSEKHVYHLLIGKPNPAKLANFVDIDAFVLIACPENSLLDNRDFLRPVITPYELEVALSDDVGVDAWIRDGYPLDVSNPAHLQVVSSVDVDELSLAPRADMTVGAHLSQAAAAFLKQRSWSGLTDEVGESLVPARAIPGRSGRPVAYDNEVRESSRGTGTR